MCAAVRLVDVKRKCVVRFADVKNIADLRYVALSYVWGEALQNP